MMPSVLRWLECVMAESRFDIHAATAAEEDDELFAARFPDAFKRGLDHNCRLGREHVVKFITRNCLVAFADALELNNLLVEAWCASCASGHLRIARYLEGFMDTENVLLASEYTKQFDRALDEARRKGLDEVVAYMALHDFEEQEFAWDDD